MALPEARSRAPGAGRASLAETSGSAPGQTAGNGGPPPRMLLVARGFPPASDPTAYRWLRFASGLMQRGWHVEVLTSEPVPRPQFYEPELMRRIPTHMTVHRAHAGFYEPRVQRARLERVTAGVPNDVRENRAAGVGIRPFGALRAALRDFDQNITMLKIPDPSFEWILPGILLGLRVLAGRRFDLIVSSGAPFSSHIVAHGLARWSRAPWVADFSDPYAGNPFWQRPEWRKRIDRALERQWFADLAGAIVPVPEMKLLFVEDHPELPEDAIHVVPYGYDETLYARAQPAVFNDFTLVHTGTFYPRMRDPGPFLHGLSLVRELPIRVLHAGPMQSEYAAMLERLDIADRVKVLGMLSRDRLAPLQLGASALLLIGNRGGLQLPGKLLDYLGARRPILALRNDAHDIAANLVVSRHAGLVVANEAEAIAGGLRQLYEDWRSRTLDTRYALDGAEDFSWRLIEDDLDRRLRGFVSPIGGEP